MPDLINDSEIVAAIRATLILMGMEPADDIGRAKLRDEIHKAGLPAASVTIGMSNRKTVITLGDGRVIRAWTRMPM